MHTQDENSEKVRFTLGWLHRPTVENVVLSLIAGIKDWERRRDRAGASSKKLVGYQGLFTLWWFHCVHLGERFSLLQLWAGLYVLKLEFYIFWKKKCKWYLFECLFYAVRVFSGKAVLNWGLETPRGQQGVNNGSGEKFNFLQNCLSVCLHI